MFEKEKISAQQFGILVFLYTIGSTILLSPSGLASIAKQDGWLAAVLGIGIGIIFILIYSALANLFPDMTFVEYSEKILGKWMGKMVSLLFVLFSFIGAATVLFHMGNFLVTQIMPGTPIQVFNATLTLVVILGLSLGIEVFARTSETFLPWVVFLLSFLILSVVPQVDIKNIQPILEDGIKPLMKASLSFTSVAALPCIVFSMIIPHVKKRENVQKVFILSMALGGMVVVMITFLTISVLGTHLTAKSAFPSYILAKKINVGNFLTRIEVIVAILWFITIYYKILLYFYACILGTAQIFRLKSYRPIIVPFGILLFFCSLIVYPNIVYAAEWDSTTWVVYAFTFGFFIPLLLFIIAKIRF
ncbi:MAG TPA: endospore germination permease [Bacillus sp. (in: firmicutes)]|nr:endospore germination permease [Bacillus sp. (in: firmicutes)]